MTDSAETMWSKRSKLEKPDECYTPEYAMKILLPFLNKEMVIWDCAFGSGRLAEHFRKYGFKVIGDPKIDFIKDSFVKQLGQDGDADIIITNPPYSIKDKFLEKAFEIGKPFAFLLPTKALGEQKRGKMFREHGIQLIIPDKRINFEIPSKKSAAWFHTSWFCYGLNLPKDLNFVELEDE